MATRSRTLQRLLLSCLPLPLILFLFVFRGSGQVETGWRISPEKINIQAGSDRTLQVLDDLAQELTGAEWSVDEPRRASIEQQDGRAVLHAREAGTVRVSAIRDGQTRFREITIWPADKPIPNGTTTWGTHPIGPELGDISAVPGYQVTIFSLERGPDGSTYLRGVADDGIQHWAWKMPEATRKVDLVCGDWLGGALISANRDDSFTLYTVGNDGKLRWKQTLDGARKAHAYTHEHTVFILSQYAKDTVAKLTAFDEESGKQKFELTLPESHRTEVNVTQSGGKAVCTPGTRTVAARSLPSGLFVNIDGFAYLAFTVNESSIGAADCTAGTPLNRSSLNSASNERVQLWQIQPDGTLRSTVVSDQSDTAPTGGIIPDGLGGVLLSMRQGADEMIYRLSERGEVVYKMPLPKYAGPLHDGIVLGENNLGFTTRGSSLLAFDVPTGKELWTWKSTEPGIQVFAALANGGCIVQTPTALVQVDSPTQSHEIYHGKAMIDWQGRLLVKHN